MHTPTSRTRHRINPPITPVTPDTPQSTSVGPSPVWSSATNDISLASSQSSLTPSFDRLALGRGQGHPHKKLQPPTCDDYSMEGTKKEQDMWVHCKSAEQWRYNKLMSEGADAYRQSENLCSSKFYYEKKKVTGKKSAAVGKCPDAVDDDDFNDRAEAEKASENDVAMKKSHIRCIHQNVNYVIYIKYVKYLCQNSLNIPLNFILVLINQLQLPIVVGGRQLKMQRHQSQKLHPKLGTYIFFTYILFRSKRY